LKDVPEKISTGKQVSIYALSVLAPPLGLWPGLKYIFQKDEKAKMVGAIALILTIISTALTFWITMQFMAGPLNQINQMSNQINQIQKLN
jgi:hypothetical protein